MPVDSISGSSSIMAASALSRLSRPPEMTPDTRQAAAEENNALRTSESVNGAAPARLTGPEETNGSVGTRVSVAPSPNNTEGELQRASSELSRSNPGGGPSASEMRAASEAYRAEAAARDQMAQQQRQGGVRSADVLA